MDYEALRLHVEDGVATITLHRPEAFNALSVRMREELVHVVRAVTEDEAVGAILLTGAGKAFCAGGDKTMFAELGGEERIKGLRTHQSWIATLLRCDKPVIAAVNGAAVGGGCSIALACDFVIASDRARFGEVYITLGLVPDLAPSLLLPLAVGLTRARELLMTGRIIDAAEAERIGMVNRVVPHEELMAEATAFARAFADGPRAALGKTKQTLSALFHDKLDIALMLEAEAQRVLIDTPDHREGLQALWDKREPRFGSGHGA